MSDTKITIEINSQSAHSKVIVQTPDKRVITKRVSVSDLPDLIRDSSSAVAKEYDTGFISPNLIRESIASNQVRRLYLFPELSFTCHLNNYGLDEFPFNRLNGDNKYSISYENIENQNYLVIPNFVYRNFGLFIINTNTEEFNCVSHYFGCITTNMFNQVNSESVLRYSMLNHFDNRVCWHGSFDQSILSSRDTTRQSNAVFNYLNSNFNNDLTLKNYPSIAKAVQYRNQGLEDFFKEIYEDFNWDTFVDHYNVRSRQGYLLVALTVYYLSTHLKLKFQDLCDSEYDGGIVNFMEYY